MKRGEGRMENGEGRSKKRDEKWASISLLHKRNVNKKMVNSLMVNSLM